MLQLTVDEQNPLSVGVDLLRGRCSMGFPMVSRLPLGAVVSRVPWIDSPQYFSWRARVPFAKPPKRRSVSK